MNNEQREATVFHFLLNHAAPLLQHSLNKMALFFCFQFCFIFNLILNTLSQTAKQAWAGQAAWAVRASVPILVLVFITKVAQVSEPSEPTNEASSEPPGIMIPESGTVRN